MIGIFATSFSVDVNINCQRTCKWNLSSCNRDVQLEEKFIPNVFIRLFRKQHLPKEKYYYILYFYIKYYIIYIIYFILNIIILFILLYYKHALFTNKFSPTRSTPKMEQEKF